MQPTNTTTIQPATTAVNKDVGCDVLAVASPPQTLVYAQSTHQPTPDRGYRYLLPVAIGLGVLSVGLFLVLLLAPNKPAPTPAPVIVVPPQTRSSCLAFCGRD